jgi:unsaturated rhamnogalacturonyl hydrolase
MLATLLLWCSTGGGQTSAPPPSPAPLTSSNSWAGDDPSDPGPLATGLDASLRHKAIRQAVRKVADWQLARANAHFNLDWTYATLYRGLIAASGTLRDAKYEEAVLAAARQFQWQLGPRIAHADDEAVAQAYLYFYGRSHDAQLLAPTRAAFDKVLAQPDDPLKPLWWWCDALFMAPVSWVEMSRITGDPAYLAFMDREWWITSSLLYDSADHLYFRDATYLQTREANGRKVYWSRGNGWVIAGLARVLEAMPANYPHRALYVAQFREMAARLASLQGADGLWRPGLLDADSYPLPEVSGSAFYVYAMAWGINHRILDRATYLPTARKGWKGLVGHVYEDGRLGSIQPIGGAPGKYNAGSSYVFGTGAFLLAGSEVDRLAAR